MRPSEQRNLIVAVGGGGAVLIVGVVAAMLLRQPAPPAAPPHPRTSAGLQVELGAKDANAPLRCFVNGRFVGMETTARCAEQNGVPPGALDVGVDASGALAGGEAGSVALRPVEAASPPAAALAPAAGAGAGEPPVADTRDCLRYGPAGWRSAGTSSLDACVRTLFAGRCVDQGDAIYGRWGSQTLRLQPGRAEISSDNKNFRTLTKQAADCSFSPA